MSERHYDSNEWIQPTVSTGKNPNVLNTYKTLQSRKIPKIRQLRFRQGRVVGWRRSQSRGARLSGNSDCEGNVWLLWQTAGQIREKKILWIIGSRMVSIQLSTGTRVAMIVDGMAWRSSNTFNKSHFSVNHPLSKTIFVIGDPGGPLGPSKR